MQVLFAARVMSDILGRLLPQCSLIMRKQGLLSFGIVKAAMTPLFFLYISSSFTHHNDIVAVVYVALFWLLSGYINTIAYVSAPRWVVPGGSAKAASFMALTFQTGCLLALLVAFALEHISSAPLEH